MRPLSRGGVWGLRSQGPQISGLPPAIPNYMQAFKSSTFGIQLLSFQPLSFFPVLYFSNSSTLPFPALQLSDLMGL